MSFNMTLLAVKRGDKEQLLHSMQLLETGEQTSGPDRGIYGYAVGDHYVVWQDWSFRETADHTYYRNWGAFVDLLSMEVAETSMIAVLRFWSKARQKWEIVADDQSGQSPGVTGKLPKNISACMERYQSKEGFELGPAMFSDLTGFDYSNLSSEQWDVLKIGPPHLSLIERLTNRIFRMFK